MPHPPFFGGMVWTSHPPFFIQMAHDPPFFFKAILQKIEGSPFVYFFFVDCVFRVLPVFLVRKNLLENVNSTAKVGVLVMSWYLHKIVQNWLELVTNLRQFCAPFLWCTKRNTSILGKLARNLRQFCATPLRERPLSGTSETLRIFQGYFNLRELFLFPEVICKTPPKIHCKIS